MSAEGLDLLLVRPAAGTSGFDQPLRVGSTAAYVLVDLGGPAEQPPLVRCQVVYVGNGRMRVLMTDTAPPALRSQLSRRLLAGVADRMREAGARRLQGTAADGTLIDIRL